MTELEHKMLQDTHDTVLELTTKFEAFLNTREDTCPVIKRRFDKNTTILAVVFAGIASVPGILSMWG